MQAYDLKVLILLGDVFEVRDRLDARVLNLFLKLIAATGIQTVWITGQHDSYQPHRATVEGLRDFNIMIIDRAPARLWENVYGVPHSRETTTYRRWLDEVPNHTVVFTHIGLREVLHQWVDEPEKLVSVREFDRFAQTVSGDIHNPAALPDERQFLYVGAPSQRDFRDVQVAGRVGVGHQGGLVARLPVAHPKHVVFESAQALACAPAQGPIVAQVRSPVPGDIELPTFCLSAEWQPAPIENTLSLQAWQPSDDVKVLLEQFLATCELENWQRTFYQEIGWEIWESGRT